MTPSRMLYPMSFESAVVVLCVCVGLLIAWFGFLLYVAVRRDRQNADTPDTELARVILQQIEFTTLCETANHLVAPGLTLSVVNSYLVMVNVWTSRDTVNVLDRLTTKDRVLIGKAAEARLRACRESTPEKRAKDTLISEWIEARRLS